jgi:hypothetical protein
MRFFVVILSVVLVVGCASPALDHLAQLQRRAPGTALDFSDGVSEVEAYKIALGYLRISEGYVTVPVEDAVEWRMSVYQGYAPTHAFDVFVDKRTGATRVVPPAPNKALEPTRGAVTPPADAGVAPAPRVAHL